MDFLRRHGFLLGCAAAAAAGVALIVTGLQAMPRVVQSMEQAKGLYSGLDSLQNNPVNLRSIQAEEERVARIVEDRDRVVARGVELHARHKPLVDKVFPESTDETRRQFRRQYGVAMQELVKLLRGGQPATPGEVETMRERITNELRRAEETGQAGTGPARTAAGVLTRAGARLDPKARADLAAAQRLYCYLQPFEVAETTSARPGVARPVSSLDFDPAMRETGTIDAPYPDECWRAQLNYWIQKDVVEAIAALNNEAAEAALERDEDRWVGMMPVKEVVSVRISRNYVPPRGDSLYAGAKPGEFTEALPPGTADSTFTGTGQSEHYEVLQFTLRLIMDQREISRLVEKLSTDSFHTLVRVAYKPVPVNRDMSGKIYGDGPTVNVVLDFETVMLGEYFRRWMPTEVCERDQIPCPPRG